MKIQHFKLTKKRSYRAVALNLVLCLGVLTFPASGAADQEPNNKWELITHKSGISVFRRIDPNSDMFEFKSHGYINAHVARIITLLQDVPLMPQWVEGCSESELIEKNYNARSFDMQIGQFYTVLYAVNDSPWPVSDRDYVLNGRLRVDKKREIAYVDLLDIKGRKPAVDGRVRMKFMKVRITLKPVDNYKRTWMQLYVHVDPAGWIPSWAVNFVTKSIPYKSMMKLRQLVNGTDYDPEMEKLVYHHMEKLLGEKAKEQ